MERPAFLARLGELLELAGFTVAPCSTTTSGPAVLIVSASDGDRFALCAETIWTAARHRQPPAEEFCTCPPAARDWFGVANVVIGDTEKMDKAEAASIREARRYAGRVLCQRCGLEADWKGESVGQTSLNGAAWILQSKRKAAAA
jgi:RNA polymerase subunit RPABC4/transcription elongation factor Spt4